MVSVGTVSQQPAGRKGPQRPLPYYTSGFANWKFAPDNPQENGANLDRGEIRCYTYMQMASFQVYHLCQERQLCVARVSTAAGATRHPPVTPQG